MNTSNIPTEQDFYEVADDNKIIKCGDVPNGLYKVEEFNFVENGKYGPYMILTLNSLKLRCKAFAPSSVLKMINELRKQRNIDPYIVNESLKKHASKLAHSYFSVRLLFW